MADVDALISQAKKLGAAIGQQAVVRHYRELSRQLDLDIGARSLLEQFQQAMEVLAVKEATGQPLDLAEKQKIQSLQQSVSIHPFLKKLIDAQIEYMDLMRDVQTGITEGLNQPADAIIADDNARSEAPASRLIIPG